MNEEEFRAYFERRMYTANSICEEYLPIDAVDAGFEVGFTVDNEGGLKIRTAVDYQQLSNLSLRLFDHGWIIMDVDGSSYFREVENDDVSKFTNSKPRVYLIYQHSGTGKDPKVSVK